MIISRCFVRLLGIDFNIFGKIGQSVTSKNTRQ